MACHSVNFGGGVKGIVCTRERRRRCAFCSAWSSRLCDFRKFNGKHCSAPLCLNCRTVWNIDQDLCPVHKHAPAALERAGIRAPEQLALRLVAK